jgi:hypothetical protein
MTPVFVALYFLTVPSGTWGAVLVIEIVATLLVGYAIGGYYRAYIEVDKQGITERGFFGVRRHVPIADIGSIFCAETYDASSRTTVPQLFIRSHQGTQLVRMRGQFWSRESMDHVVATLGIPHQFISEAMSTSELREHHSSLLYWFERRPGIAALAFATVVAAVGVGVYWLFQAFSAA